MKRKCERCGQETDEAMVYDGMKLCRFCWKKQDLHDQRDWEDDPRSESEVDEQ